MPESRDFALIFGNREKDDYMPTALVAGQAGAWAAERGEYRIAQQLMGLAAALQQAEIDHNLHDVSSFGEQPNTVRVPRLAIPMRNEQPRGYTKRVPGEAGLADVPTEVIRLGGSTAPRDCATCGLLIVWNSFEDSWQHSSPGTAFEAAGEHDPTLG